MPFSTQHLLILLECHSICTSVGARDASPPSVLAFTSWWLPHAASLPLLIHSTKPFTFVLPNHWAVVYYFCYGLYSALTDAQLPIHKLLRGIWMVGGVGEGFTKSSKGSERKNVGGSLILKEVIFFLSMNSSSAEWEKFFCVSWVTKN